MVKAIKEKIKENNFKTDCPRNFWSWSYNIIAFRKLDTSVVLLIIALLIILLKVEIIYISDNVKIKKKATNIPYIDNLSR